jgi:hypothetical protein
VHLLVSLHLVALDQQNMTHIPYHDLVLFGLGTVVGTVIWDQLAALSVAGSYYQVCLIGS